MGVITTADKLKLRGVITLLVNNLKIADPDGSMLASLTDKINIAQTRVVAEMRCLQTYIGSDSPLSTVADQRAYNLVDDWGITNFLGMANLYVDGWEVPPLKNGWDDLDLKNDPTSTVIDGYFYKAGVVYMEPIPSDALDVYIRYIRRPASLGFFGDSALELTTEYLPAILAFSEALCYPTGSPDNLRCLAVFDNELANLRYLESLTTTE